MKMKRLHSFSAFFCLISTMLLFPLPSSGDEITYLKNLRNARIHAESAEWDRAIELYRQALTENPQGIEALKELAGIYLSQKSEPASACPIVDTLKALIPGDPDVRVFCSICEPENSKREAPSQREQGPGPSSLPGAPAPPPLTDEKWKFYLAANESYGKQDFEGALQNIEKALLLAPDDIPLLILKAKICMILQRQDDAKKIVSQLEEQGIEKIILPNSMIELSAVADMLGDAKLAFALLKKSCTGLFKGNVTIYLIDFCERHSNLKEARELLESSIRSCELCGDSLWIAAHIAAQQGDLIKAVYYLNYMTKVNPSDATVYLWLGQYYIQLKTLDGAIENYEKVLKLKPDIGDVTVYFNLGYAYFTKKNYGKSAFYYDRAVKIKPDFAEAHLNLGMAYVGMKEWQKAKTALKRSLQLNPDLYDAYYNLYLVAQGMGDAQGAMWYLQKFNEERARVELFSSPKKP